MATKSTTASKTPGRIVNDIELQDYSETSTSPSSTSNYLPLDMANGNVFQSTLTENLSGFTITNPPEAGKVGSVTLKLSQNDSVAYTVDFSQFLWNGGTAPTMTPTLSGIDFYTFTTFDSGSTWFGFTAGQAMA